MENEYVLIMEHISKQFPGVRALSDVELRARKGTVHALMGENGAGKSTLMKCLIGIYAPDSGTITFKGEKLNITNTHYALSKGISMIHQELSPIPQMTVAENIYLGREPVTWNGLVDMGKMNRMAAELLDRLHIKIKPTAKMHELSIGNTQVAHFGGRLDLDAQPFQELGGHPVHFAHVYQAIPGCRFATEVDVLSNRHLRNGAQFLVDHRNTLGESLVGIGDVQSFTSERYRARVRYIYTNQTLHQRRFTRAVFPHQRVHRCLAGTELDVAKSTYARERLGDPLHSKDVVVFHR